MYKLDVDRLVKDELEYELKIRGVSESGTVDSLKKCLRSLLSLEKSGSSVHSSHSLEPQSEITECTNKIKEVADAIAAFSGTAAQSRKIETKISHLLGRIDRIPDQDKVVDEERSKILVSLATCISDYEDRVRLLTTQQTQPVAPLDPHFSNSVFQTVPSTPTGHSTVHNLNTPSPNVSNFNLTQAGPSTQMLPSTSFNSLPVWKWDVKFSGHAYGLSFNAFLERVNELCRSRGVSKADLFRCAADLFEGDALNYYHLVVRYCSDWDGLVKLLKDEFLPSYLGDKLWRQILERTQGNNEPIGIYVAAMTKLFDRMPLPVSDELRLKVLRANILPFYQERLALHDIHTPFEVIELCRKLEETRLRVEELRPPRRGNLSLEPDLDYNPPRREVSKHQDKPIVREVEGNQGSSNSNSFVCFKCNQPNHMAKNCTSKILKCFKCGKKDFTKKNCPDCNKKQSKNSGNDSGRRR